MRRLCGSTLAVKRRSALLVRVGGQLLEQQRAEAATLLRVLDLERDLCHSAPSRPT